MRVISWMCDKYYWQGEQRPPPGRGGRARTGDAGGGERGGVTNRGRQDAIDLPAVPLSGLYLTKQSTVLRNSQIHYSRCLKSRRGGHTGHKVPPEDTVQPGIGSQGKPLLASLSSS